MINPSKGFFISLLVKLRNGSKIANDSGPIRSFFTPTLRTYIEVMLFNMTTLIALTIRYVESKVRTTYFNSIVDKIFVLLLRKMFFKITMKSYTTIESTGEFTTMKLKPI